MAEPRSSRLAVRLALSFLLPTVIGLAAIGVVAQDDWVQIVPSGEGQWDVWPAERHFYMRSRDLLSRDLVLAENWRMLAAAESANGFLLIGWSTAFLVAVTARVRIFEAEIGQSDDKKAV